MRLWSGFSWMAREGTGLETSRRIWKMAWARNELSAVTGDQGGGIFLAFLASAERVVQAFGPGWSRRPVGRRNLGTWILVGLWILPLTGVFLF